MHTTHDEVDLELVLLAKDQVAEDVHLLTLRRVDAGPLPAWSPGAHVDLELDAGLVRQYSLCGDPADRSTWTVAVLVDPQSRGGSSFVHTSLAPGSRVLARGPRNNFRLVEAPRYLFIAGGIGVTPLVPMVEQVARDGAEWRMVYGGRRRGSMAFLDDLRRHGERVEILTEEEHGRIPVDEVLRWSDHRTAVYCCGPESLVSAVEERFGPGQPGRLHVERFRPKAQAPAPATTFEVEARRSGRTVTVGPGVSILDALTEAGVPVLQSCTEGICGTCEVIVVDGRPDHRDSILTAEEREAGETMFVCVSRSLSRRLVLDV